MTKNTKRAKVTPVCSKCGRANVRPDGGSIDCRTQSACRARRREARRAK